MTGTQHRPIIHQETNTAVQQTINGIYITISQFTRVWARVWIYNIKRLRSSPEQVLRILSWLLLCRRKVIALLCNALPLQKNATHPSTPPRVPATGRRSAEVRGSRRPPSPATDSRSWGRPSATPSPPAGPTSLSTPGLQWNSIFAAASQLNLTYTGQAVGNTVMDLIPDCGAPYREAKWFEISRQF